MGFCILKEGWTRPPTLPIEKIASETNEIPRNPLELIEPDALFAENGDFAKIAPVIRPRGELRWTGKQ